MATWSALLTPSSVGTDVELEARLFKAIGRQEPCSRVPIDCAWVHRALRRTGVTLQTLWTEYQEGARVRLGPEELLPLLLSREPDSDWWLPLAAPEFAWRHGERRRALSFGGVDGSVIQQVPA